MTARLRYRRRERSKTAGSEVFFKGQNFKVEIDFKWQKFEVEIDFKMTEVLKLELISKWQKFSSGYRHPRDFGPQRNRGWQDSVPLKTDMMRWGKPNKYQDKIWYNRHEAKLEAQEYEVYSVLKEKSTVVRNHIMSDRLKYIWLERISFITWYGALRLRTVAFVRSSDVRVSPRPIGLY